MVLMGSVTCNAKEIRFYQGCIGSSGYYYDSNSVKVERGIWPLTDTSVIVRVVKHRNEYHNGMVDPYTAKPVNQFDLMMEDGNWFNASDGMGYIDYLINIDKMVYKDKNDGRNKWDSVEKRELMVKLVEEIKKYYL